MRVENFLPPSALNHALKVALKAAEQGPRVGGNPQVGACLLDGQGRILAVGYHAGKGSAHAETRALSLAPADTPWSECTLLVTLEPCNHTGSTGPCARAIAQSGIKRVVYAVNDPHPVAAGGSETLRAAGVHTYRADEIDLDPTLISQARELVHAWSSAVLRARPWLIAKSAQSLDGYCAARDHTSQWITNALARAHAHRVRSTVDAIIVGSGTLQADNPALSARTPAGELLPFQPLRVVVGESPLELSPKSEIVFPGGGQARGTAELAKRAEPCLHYRTRDLAVVLADLYARGCKYVLLEGGPTLMGAALRGGFVDELHLYQAPLLLGGGRRAWPELEIATLSAAPRWRVAHTQTLGDNQFWRLLAPRETEN